MTPLAIVGFWSLAALIVALNVWANWPELREGARSLFGSIRPLKIRVPVRAHACRRGGRHVAPAVPPTQVVTPVAPASFSTPAAKGFDRSAPPACLRPLGPVETDTDRELRRALDDLGGTRLIAFPANRKSVH